LEFNSFLHLRQTRLILDYLGELILKRGFGPGFIQIAGQRDFQGTLAGIAQARTHRREPVAPGQEGGFKPLHIRAVIP